MIKIRIKLNNKLNIMSVNYIDYLYGFESESQVVVHAKVIGNYINIYILN
jgi:hypothetical protein